MTDQDRPWIKGPLTVGYGDGLSGPTTASFRPFVQSKLEYEVISKEKSTVALLPQQEFSQGPQATARLFAAAPEMFEALQAAKGHLEDDLNNTKMHPIGHCPVLDLVNAAMKKALEGEG